MLLDRLVTWTQRKADEPWSVAKSDETCWWVELLVVAAVVNVVLLVRMAQEIGGK